MPAHSEVEIMADIYDDNAIDYFEDEEDMDAADAAFMHGYLAS